MRPRRDSLSRSVTTTMESIRDLQASNTETGFSSYRIHDIDVVSIHQNADVSVHGFEDSLDYEALAASLLPDNLRARLAGFLRAAVRRSIVENTDRGLRKDPAKIEYDFRDRRCLVVTGDGDSNP